MTNLGRVPMAGLNIFPSDSFFVGPDEDEATLSSDNFAYANSSSLPQTPKTLSSHGPPPQQRLFLDDSDDEEIVPKSHFSTLKRSQAAMMEDNTSDAEIAERTNKDIDSMPDDSSRLPSPSPVPQKTQYSSQPQKKRRLSPHTQAEEGSAFALPAYLGDVLIPNAWSTISGGEYVKPNDIIYARRDQDEEYVTVKLKSHGANSKKKTENKKQVTLTSMMGVQPQKFPKKKRPDTIVRLVTKDDVGA